jgi:hypothetical protein
MPEKILYLPAGRQGGNISLSLTQKSDPNSARPGLLIANVTLKDLDHPLDKIFVGIPAGSSLPPVAGAFTHASDALL